MKEQSIFDVALVLLLGATFSTIIVVEGWWKQGIASTASAIKQELVAPQRAS